MLIAIVLFTSFFHSTLTQVEAKTSAGFKIENQKLYDPEGRRHFLKIAWVLGPFQNAATSSVQAYKSKQYNTIQMAVYWHRFDQNGDGIVDEGSQELAGFKNYLQAIKDAGLYAVIDFQTYNVGGKGVPDAFFAAHPSAQALDQDGKPVFDDVYFDGSAKVPSIFDSSYTTLSRKFIKDFLNKIETSNIIYFETAVEPQYIPVHFIDYHPNAISKFNSQYGREPGGRDDTQWNLFRAEELADWIDGDALAVRSIVPDALISVDYLEDGPSSIVERRGNATRFLEKLDEANIINVVWHYGYGCPKRCDFVYDRVNEYAPEKNWAISEHMTVNGDLVDEDITDLLDHTIEKGNTFGWNFVNASPSTANGFTVYNDDFSPKGNMGFIDTDFKNVWQLKALGISNSTEGFGADFLSDTFPQQVSPGEEVTFTLTVKNIGSKEWDGSSYTDSGKGRIVLYNNENSDFGLFDNVPLKHSDRIAPNQSINIQFTMTAPTTAGSYQLALQMAKDKINKFGEIYPVEVNVVGDTPIVTVEEVIEAYGSDDVLADLNNDGIVNSMDFAIVTQ